MRAPSKGFNILVSVVTLGCSMLHAMPAHAEGYLTDASFGLGSGLEGGDPGTGRLGFHRARLRILTGIDLRDDEDESDALGFRAFVELEKRGSVGAEARYERWMTHTVGVYCGLTGTVAPETLFGGGVGATVVIPFGKRAGLYLEPSFQALPVGSDLPHGTVLVWGLFTAGIQLGL
jgi:hypothetical protein